MVAKTCEPDERGLRFEESEYNDNGLGKCEFYDGKLAGTEG